MENWRDYFRGKRITVMGLGLLGGIGDIVFLAEQGADLTVTDLKSSDELRTSILELARFPNIKYTLSRHDLSDFRNRDLIVMAPSTPPGSPFIAEARKNNIPITMWAALFSRFAREAGATIVGITGTRGKSTTTAMIGCILHTAGKKVIEGGNIRGSAMLPQLLELTKESYVVLELDSWKIQGFREEHFSPHIAVFTTFYPDHMDYYKNDLDRYLADKANIFLYQKPNDMLILGSQCAGRVQEKYQKQFVGKFEVWGAADLPRDIVLRVPGEHNRYDAALALGAARSLGIDDASIIKGLQAFKGIEGRLQFVREFRKTKIYNDNNATTPEATIAALQSVEGPITLIIGGSEKNLDLKELIAEIKNVEARVIVLTHPNYTGSERLKNMLADVAIPLEEAASLAEAIQAAVQSAKSGSILFSPAFASFGMFKNEYDRNDLFLKFVRELS